MGIRPVLLDRPYLKIAGAKVAKRKVVCKRCGKSIPKGEKYFLEEWYDGPYLHRRVICRECAEKMFIEHVKMLLLYFRREAVKTCVEGRKNLMPVLRYIALVYAEKLEEIENELRKQCEKKIDREGYHVRFTKKEKRIAEELGIDLEKLIKQLDPKAYMW